MKYFKLFSFVFVILLSVVSESCQSKQEKLEKKIIKTILTEEKGDSEIDSVKIVEIDTLTRYGYVKVILEQLEYMEYDYESRLVYGDSVSETERTEIELMIEEIRTTTEHLRLKSEENTDNKAFFCYFILTELWHAGESQQFYYIMSPDFDILDDPFSDNLID